MPAVTFTEIAEAAFGILNVFLPGEALPAADGATARATCNRMLSQWRTRRLFIPLAKRELFDLTANDGGPYDPYTIGPGGDLDTDPRPPTQNSILQANLVLTASSPEVRVPLGIYTTDAYFANQIPALSNSQPTGLFYNPTYADDLGAVFLWPVPTTATNDLELLLVKPIAKFDDLDSTYYLPDGADDTIVYQLALRLQGTYGKQMDAEDKRLALESLQAFKRSNVQLSDLANDAYLFTTGRRTLYNILSGTGG